MDSETPSLLPSAVLACFGKLPSLRAPKAFTEEELEACEARLQATWEKLHGGDDAAHCAETARPPRRKK